MPLIAGHSFLDQPHGRACEWCGRTWINLLDNRDLWKVGELDIAHSGALVGEEVKQLEAEVQRVWDLVVGVADV